MTVIFLGFEPNFISAIINYASWWMGVSVLACVRACGVANYSVAEDDSQLA